MSHRGAGRFTWDVPLEDEVPLVKMPDYEFASENYCINGFDPERQIAFYLLMGRWVKDPSIIREVFYFYLPDGSYLFSQSFGRGDYSRGPNAACLSLDFEEPGKRIRIRYSGPVQHVTLDRLTDHSGLPTVLDQLDFDVLFEANAPLWYFGEDNNTTWGSWHTEQQGRATGSVIHNGERQDFSGPSYRDHSRGPRNLGQVRGHAWVNGQFEDGSSMAMYQVWHEGDAPNQPALSLAKLTDGETSIDATVDTGARITNASAGLDPYELTFTAADRSLKIKCFPLSMAVLSVTPTYSHFMPGIPIGVQEYLMTCLEQPTRFEASDGRIAYGWTDRSYYRGRDDIVFNGDAHRKLRESLGLDAGAKA